MMGKRMPSLSFITFATGFAFALYGVFVVVCDIGGLQLGIFTTFGTNALAAYFLHHLVEEAVSPLVPHDARCGTAWPGWRSSLPSPTCSCGTSRSGRFTCGFDRILPLQTLRSELGPFAVRFT